MFTKNPTFMHLLFKTALVGLFCAVQLSTTKAQVRPRVIAYYTGSAEELPKYPLAGLTHIIYSFLHLKGSALSFDSPAQEAKVKKIVALKANFPGLKINISLGGWEGCYTCSQAFSTAEGRQAFANSTLAILKNTQLDGIDLDWEYPAIEGPPGHAFSPADKDNFTDLVKRLRTTLGNSYEITFAAGGFTKYLEQSVDWQAVAPLVDYINLMTYDLVGGYSKVTGHHTPLMGSPQQTQSTDRCVQWLLAHGVESQKLVVGAAFYARVWKQVSPEGNGLYQAGVFKWGVDYKAFGKRLNPDSGWVYHWDKSVKARFAYNTAKGEFATFDDNRSLKEKVKYVKKHKLGGIMFWELGNDTYANGRLQSIYNAIGRK
ncbi:MAG: glycoside hydrolase family 18 protein [Bacteroidetes bacterium]|nr:MAG: glycoside hydrolase family 18 protein [Bacteroidota bacterium]